MNKNEQIKIYDALNKLKQKPAQPDTQLELFQMAAPAPEYELSDYWYYSDLHELFGGVSFPTQPSMQLHAYDRLIMPYELIPELKEKCPPRGYFHDTHIDREKRAYKIDSHQYYNAYDVILSRYACWCFARHKSHMNFERAYFIAPVASAQYSFETVMDLSKQFRRIELRNQIGTLKNVLDGILSKHIRTNNDYREFYHATTQCLFGGKSKEYIFERSEINPKSDKDSLLDYMYPESLNARICATRRAIDRYNRHQNQTLTALRDILSDELYTERIRMKHRTNRLPEEDISSQHKSDIQKNLNILEEKFIRIYSAQRLR